MATSAAMRARRWLWTAVPFFALVELGAHFAFAGRAPDVRQWQQVRAAVAELRKQDELVVVAPHWAEPLARHAFGDALMPLAQVARPDESAIPKAIEVSVLGHAAPELAGWRRLNEKTLGPFRLAVLENPSSARPRFNFVDALGPERTSVFVEQGEQRRACNFSDRARSVTGGLHGHVAFPRRRFQCPGGDAFFVGVTVIDDERYRPRRCIWAHPMLDGPLVIAYRDVPLGDVVRGHAGLSWFIHRDGGRPPVDLELRVNGQTLGQHSHRDEQGWAPFSFGLGKYAGQTATVELVVRSAEIRERHFCFEADTR